MSQAMVKIFEGHDRHLFQVTAFSIGAVVNDEMRRRLEEIFDQFFDVQAHTDQGIANFARQIDVDIAVDLMGFTQHSRTGIFSNRCAPIQVNYIGYPGTMGSECIDYIIADPVLIPVDYQKFFSEKVVYLPNSYHANSYMLEEVDRKTHNIQFSREEFDLPSDGFVFCCFNNSYKILPAVFHSWMRILSEVKGSVLWLLEENSYSSENLRREAEQRGISSVRLIFAKRLPLAAHLARHRCADLFLDTLPYNAHTTGLDALWAGLPIITHIGDAFAGRVAASLLNAVGLPELITTSVDEYEQLAIRLATHPVEMRALKQKLADNRLSSKLFDTPLYVRHLESAYTAMYERYQAGLEPEHIYVQDESKTVE